MKKKFILFWIVLVIGVLIYGQYGKTKMVNCGLSDIHNVSDIWDLRIKLSSIMDSETFYKESDLEEVYNAYLATDYTMVVKATGNLKLYYRSMNQEVEVIKVIDNATFDECSGVNNIAKLDEKIWINSYFGIDFNFPNENENYKDIYYNQLSVMPMNEGDTYLVFANDDDLNHIYDKKVYHIQNNFYLEYFNLSSDESFTVQKDLAELELSDFKGSEFIANSDSVLEKMEAFKAKIISKLKEHNCL